MTPRPKPYTTLERIERWFRRRRRLKTIAQSYRCNPHPVVWYPQLKRNALVTSLPCPWSTLVVRPTKTLSDTLIHTRGYVRLRYGREPLDGELLTIKAEWYAARHRLLAQKRREHGASRS